MSDTIRCSRCGLPGARIVERDGQQAEVHDNCPAAAGDYPFTVPDPVGGEALAGIQASFLATGQAIAQGTRRSNEEAQRASERVFKGHAPQ